MLSFREWTENGQLWVQQVSSTPATRLDVVNLQVCKAVISRANSSQLQCREAIQD